MVPTTVIADKAGELSDILENDFKLSARSAGDKGDVIEETALEVRAALTNSLAAAKADQWQEAESQRLDAYTAFDTEIEPRVLPRDPELARRVERSFIDGQPPEQQGLKALLDRRAPMDELEAAYEQALNGLDNSVSMLKTAVSPTTLGFTAFTIIAREGMEAVVVLAALMAGLRGAENRETRRGIAWGAWLAVGATVLTFWLSQTVVRSLSHYGEKLEAVVSIFAVFILFIVTNWVFHKFYWVGWNAKIRSLSKAAQNVDKQRWEILALLGVGFLTVYREGFETALFLQSLFLEGNVQAVVMGVAVGAVFIALVGGLTFTFGVKLPYRRLLVITGVLVVSIMVSFLGSTVRLFQTVSWLPVHPVPGLHVPSLGRTVDGFVSELGGTPHSSAGARLRGRRLALDEMVLRPQPAPAACRGSTTRPPAGARRRLNPAVDGDLRAPWRSSLPSDAAREVAAHSALVVTPIHLCTKIPTAAGLPPSPLSSRSAPAPNSTPPPTSCPDPIRTAPAPPASKPPIPFRWRASAASNARFSSAKLSSAIPTACAPSPPNSASPARPSTSARSWATPRAGSAAGSPMTAC